MGGNATVLGTYEINAQICFPAGGIDPNAVQILTHEVGICLSYWDFAPGYFYVDGAAAAGYTSFLYDRLGVGGSDNPGPIQVVQTPLEVNIAHQLIQILKFSVFSPTEFKNVIGTGHSFGSEITKTITAQYLNDIAAAILTSFSTFMAGLQTFLTSLDL
jgi:pimeloyl-ACP methyl ester carboxylesterase